MQDPGRRLIDNHGRELNYLRLAVTDRCNLRCFYCMPEEGIHYLPKKELLTFEEIERLVRILAGMGISKIRLTGGEPFVRTDLMMLIRRLVEIPGIRDIHITTNGVLTAPLVPELKALGIASVNLSLDTLDRDRFRIITRRDAFDPVMKCFESLLRYDIPFKINTVVMQDRNIEDIVPLATLTRDHPIDVRFIEEMPFNGEGTHYPVLAWTHERILDHLRAHFSDISKVPDPPFATANHYHIPGHKGRIGIIAAFSRTFCGTCNRIRVTAQGTLRTCLYDDGTLDLRALLRSTADDDAIRKALLSAFRSRAIDGFEAEARRGSRMPATESMSTIGG
ncbi:MAG: GTP 3',8-cyclase MoaA [Cyclobacteriaceae bacterium]|nr:GTP 3',8-cyclase MoaA [Cyclobacteriaceae bacterium]